MQTAFIPSFAIMAASVLLGAHPGSGLAAGDSEQMPNLSFLEDRAELLASLAEVRATPPGPARDDAEAALLLDLAERYLAVAFVPEGRAIVAALSDAPLGPTQSARRSALGAAFALLSRRPRPDAPIPLPASPDLPGAAALRAYALVRSAQIDEGLALLTASPAALGETPPALRAHILPDLLDAAMASGRPALVEELFEHLTRTASLAEPGALHYLEARRDDLAGNAAAAAAGYADAATTATEWGHRARLADIELDLESGTSDSVEALRRLDGARAMWRGDSAALDTLGRIARIAARSGDASRAAEALGEIWWRGGRAEADAQEALSALRTFYQAGTSGDLPFEDLVEGHGRLARLFRLMPGYAALSEAFADHLLSRGATGAAAAEYAQTREHLQFGAEKGLWELPPSRSTGLVLKEAGALLDGGRVEAARPLLQEVPPAAAPADLAKLAELRMRYLVLTGDPATDAHPANSGTAPDLLSRAARTHLLARRWMPALDAYRALWQETRGEVTPDDAIGALLAAHHGGDPALLARAERRLADAGDARSDAVEGGLVPAGAPGALDAARLRGAMDRADGALRVSTRLAVDAPSGAADHGGINTSLTGGP